MEMTGEYRIEAPRDIVWEALNDPEILRNCIPGCEELDKTDEHSFEAKVKAKVGPVNSRFTGSVSLSNMNPPESYTISGEGKGGAAGFAKGSADVHLQAENDQVTVLTYKANAKVGGKLAQLGSRLIDGTAQKMASEFFSEFERQVSEKYALSSSAAAADTADATTPPAEEATAASTSQTSDQATEPPVGESAEASPAAAASQSTSSQQAAPGRGETSSTKQSAGGLPPAVWIGGAAIIVVLLLILFV
ncbi:CoxG family protein [Fodinicurvata halophila]|uniref:CoxG family protein n=1 Tax=Fodinicurvata halophila TaxID=1419723 RepID=A0ABV8UJS2_9PROT